MLLQCPATGPLHAARPLVPPVPPPSLTWMPAAVISCSSASARSHCPPRSSAEMREP